MKLHPANERIKYKYVAFLREARQLGDHSIDQVCKALDRFETYTKRRHFREYRIEQAIAFKRHLANVNGERSGKRLSKATVATTLNALREFFEWLSGQHGYRRLSFSDAAYFKPLRSDEAIARAPRQAYVPTTDQIRDMVAAMPTGTDIELRDRALVALAIVTGARDDAIASLRLKHLDLEQGRLFQDAREVRTKFRKTMTTTFFPVGKDFVAIVADWKAHLESRHGFGPDDPLFPKTEVGFGAGGEILAPRLSREGWANADPVRAVFKRASTSAGLPHFTPHSLRHTLAQLGGHLCTAPEEYKVWSQNLGHKSTLVTLTSYGTLPTYTQHEIMRRLAEKLGG